MSQKKGGAVANLVRVIDSSLIIEADRVRVLSKLSIYFSKHPNPITIAPKKVKEEAVNRPARIAWCYQVLPAGSMQHCFAMD